MRLIDADKLQERLKNCRQVIIDTYGKNDKHVICLDGVLNLIDISPTMDAIPKSAYEQVAWERDLAIMQLKDVGKGLGERMDEVVEVVRCKDCKHQTFYCKTVDCNMRTTYSCFCVLHGTCHEQDWFCADGERKSDD